MAAKNLKGDKSEARRIEMEAWCHNLHVNALVQQMHVLLYIDALGGFIWCDLILGKHPTWHAICSSCPENVMTFQQNLRCAQTRPTHFYDLC